MKNNQNTIEENKLNEIQNIFYPHCKKCFHFPLISFILDKNSPNYSQNGPSILVQEECMNNHISEKIPISEYFNEQDLNNKKCNYCNLHKSVKILFINNSIKFICKNCCGNKYLKNKNIKSLDNFNLINICCFIHNEKNFICYCKNCKKNLCNNCLEDKTHLNHEKIFLNEILLTSNEREIINKKYSIATNLLFNILNKTNKIFDENNKNIDLIYLKFTHFINNNFNLLILYKKLIDLYDNKKSNNQISYELIMNIKNIELNLNLNQNLFNEKNILNNKDINLTKDDYIIKLNDSIINEIDINFSLDNLYNFYKFKPHEHSINFLIFLEDGRISTASDNIIKIFSKENYKEEMVIREHTKEIKNYFQLNDDRLLSSSVDKKVKIIKLLSKTEYVIEQVIVNNSSDYYYSPILELNNEQLLLSLNEKIYFYNKDIQNHNYFNNNNINYYIKENKHIITNKNNESIYILNQINDDEIIICNDNNINVINFYDITNKELKTSVQLDININDISLFNDNILIIVGENILFLNLNSYVIFKTISIGYEIIGIISILDFFIVLANLEQKNYKEDDSSDSSDSDEENSNNSNKKIKLIQFENINGEWVYNKEKNFLNNEVNVFGYFNNEFFVTGTENGEINIWKQKIL